MADCNILALGVRRHGNSCLRQVGANLSWCMFVILCQWNVASHGLLSQSLEGRASHGRQSLQPPQHAVASEHGQRRGGFLAEHRQLNWIAADHEIERCQSGRRGKAQASRRAGLTVRLRGGSIDAEDADEIPCSTEKVGSLTVSTFNMWCPLFRRIPTQHPNGTQTDRTTRESAYPELYMKRHEAIIRMLLRMNSDIVCLQEFWVANEEMVAMFRSKLDSRYQWQQLNRSGARGDGIVTLLRHSIGIRDRKDILMHDMGDRVALLLRVHIPVNLSATQTGAEMLLVNTHLVFAHQPYFSIIRMRELRQILSFLELYRHTRHKDCPIMLCGDFNGPPSGFQYKHLRKLNFTSSCEDRTRWVTHKNHLGSTLCCDFIWTLNPSERPSLLERDWQAMVFYSTRQRLSAWIRRRMASGDVPVASQSGGGGAQEEATGSDDPWATVDVSFHREALSQLGYKDVVPSLTDEQLTYLLAGPDRTYVDKDRLMDAGSLFQLFDLDKSGGLDAREFAYLCADLDVRTDRSVGEVFRRLDQSRAGAITLAQFTKWWHGILPSAWGVGEGSEEERSDRSESAPSHGQRHASSEMTPPRSGSPPSAHRPAAAAQQAAREPAFHARKEGGGAGMNMEYELELVDSRVFPRKLQAGVWDDKFALSDHGVVTCRYEILPPRGYCSAVEYRAAVDYLSRSPVQMGAVTAVTAVSTEASGSARTGTGAACGVRQMMPTEASAAQVRPWRSGPGEAGPGPGSAAALTENRVPYSRSSRVESESQLEALSDARLYSAVREDAPHAAAATPPSETVP